MKPYAQGQQRIERIKRNKSILAEVEEATASAPEAVKLPQIETKKRRGGRKTTNAWPETNNVTIEEFVPALVIIFFRFTTYLISDGSVNRIWSQIFAS